MGLKDTSIHRIIPSNHWITHRINQLDYADRGRISGNTPSQHSEETSWCCHIVFANLLGPTGHRLFPRISSDRRTAENKKK
jgi:hypothetical protein